MPKNRNLTPEERQLKLEKRRERKADRKANPELQKKKWEERQARRELKKAAAHAKTGNPSSSQNSAMFTEEELQAPKRPEYLSGKYIGLWHAAKNKWKQQQYNKQISGKDKDTRRDKTLNKMMISLTLKLPHEKEESINRILSKISTEAPPLAENMGGSSSTLESARIKYQHIQDSAFKEKFLQSISGKMSDKIKMGIYKCKLESDESLNKEYQNLENDIKDNSRCSKKMLEFRKRLPTFKKKQEILNLLKNENIILISGETGCGKTTQIPQFLLEEEIENGRGSTCHIVCTQPRRISAIAMAERVADERGECCGKSVGYQIRLEKNMPRPTGSILFCTTGVLLQIMNSDPFLTKISHVILDEIHERDTTSDFVLAVLKDIIPSRPDLKVILMSATLNAEHFSNYFNNCKHIHIPGFTFPVKEYYLEDVYELLHFPLMGESNMKLVLKERNQMKPEERAKEEAVDSYISELAKKNEYSPTVLANLLNPKSNELNIQLICELIEHISYYEAPGAILVFLPGWDKISNVHRTLIESHRFPSNRFVILALHSLMPTVSQRDIFERPPQGMRKIILSTNIAETSITIDDIVYVIDCGKIKVKMFEIDDNISSLKEHWISKANANQRRGRAGRVQDGVCYHLFTKGRNNILDDYQLPEMLRIRLEEVILQAKTLQVGKIGPFLEKVIDPPDPKAVELSIQLLIAMDALDDEEQLTPLGYHLAQLPIDPQAGKMLLFATMFGCFDPISSITSSLAYKEPFVCPLGQEKNLEKIKNDLDCGRKSDHLLIAHVLSNWEQAKEQGRSRAFANHNYISLNIIELIKEMKKQFANHLYRMNFIINNNVKNELANVNSGNDGLIKAIICAGLYPNVAIIKNRINVHGKPTRYQCFTLEDGRVSIHPKSVNYLAGTMNTKFNSNFMVYCKKLKSNGIFLHDTTLIYPMALILFCHNLIIEDNRGKLKTIVVNECIKFVCEKSTADLIVELRARLKWLVDYKVSHPQPIDWYTNSDEIHILSAIIELLSIEIGESEEIKPNESDEDVNDDDWILDVL